MLDKIKNIILKLESLGFERPRVEFKLLDVIEARDLLMSIKAWSREFNCYLETGAVFTSDKPEALYDNIDSVMNSQIEAFKRGVEAKRNAKRGY